MDRTQGLKGVWDPGYRAVKCRALKGPQDRKISASGLGGFTTGIHYLGLVFLWRMQVEKGLGLGGSHAVPGKSRLTVP